jgi:hypothetical protein
MGVNFFPDQGPQSPWHKMHFPIYVRNADFPFFVSSSAVLPLQGKFTDLISILVRSNFF